LADAALEDPICRAHGNVAGIIRLLTCPATLASLRTPRSGRRSACWGTGPT